MSEQKDTGEGFSHGFLLSDARKAIAERLAGVKHKLLVLSGKGGVGKSTVAVNLACALAALGKKVGLLDADLHGPTVPVLLNLHGKPAASKDGILPLDAPGGIKVVSLGLFLQERDEAVIWRGPMKMGAIRQFLSDVVWGELDYLIIDCPPGTGDEPLSLVQLIPDPDGAILVTTPQEVALAAVRKSVTFTRKVGLKLLGVVENYAGYVCPHCRKTSRPFGHGGGEKLARFAQTRLLASIPLIDDAATRSSHGKPVAADPGHPMGAIFHELALRIVDPQ